MKSTCAWFLLSVSLGCASNVERQPSGSDSASNSGGAAAGGANAISATSTSSGGSNVAGSAGDGGSVGDGGSTSSGQTVCNDFGTECTACVAVECPADWCNCVANPDCLALFPCAQECNGDQACNQQCLSAHEAGASAALLVASCSGGPCAASCPNGGEQAGPCESCLYQECDDIMNSCLAEPACFGLWNCLKGCPDADIECQNGCYNQFEQGVDELQAVIDCAGASCPQACSN